MVRKVYILIAFYALIFTTKGQSNFILAGQHTTNDYYFKYIPDTTVMSVTPSVSTKSYSVDINNDGVLDFDFTLFASWGLGGYTYYCSISALNSNNVSLSHYDSCFFTSGSYYNRSAITRAFNYGDTINNNSNWVSAADLEYGAYVMNNFNCGANYSSDTAYIGVRVMVGSIYEYGWIKIANLSFVHNGTSSLIMGSFACENATTSIRQYDMKNNISIYPNPTASYLQVTLAGNEKIEEITLCNILGKEVVSTKQKTIDVSSLQEGVYFITLKAGEVTETKKVIIQH